MLLAMPWAPAEALVVSDEQLAELQRLVRAPKTPQKVVLRARIVLAAAAGQVEQRHRQLSFPSRVPR